MSETKTPWRPGPYVAQHSINLDGYRILAPTGAWVGEVAIKEEAQLLAAAPFLYEALMLLLADVKDYEAWQRPCHAVDVAIAALARARGEAA